MRSPLFAGSALLVVGTVFAFGIGGAQAAPFEDATEATIGTTGDWSNKVELADIDGDGTIDLIFANGGNYASAGSPQMNTVFLNSDAGVFKESGDAIFGTADLARVVKARDLNDDGIVDLFVGATYQTQSRLFLGLGGGGFVEVTTTHLPAQVGSFGDVALGDVDGDGDIDAVLADWGPGNPLNNDGGVTRLWLNNGFGAFTDATAAQMPDIAVRFSWELELVDVDNDWDLDVLVSCKSCSGSKLFHNDGTGNFVDASEQLPQYTNNYDFEAMDLDGDGYLDLVTINDGSGLKEHIFIADGTGGFTDETETLWPDSANVGEDDNMVAFLDYDSDGDADFLIGSLSGDDRLLINDGAGNLTLDSNMFSGASTPGTLGIALADLNGDSRLDVVHSQGEVASPEKVFFGVDIPVDTAPPTVGTTFAEALDDGGARIRARVHDRKSPVMPHDFLSIEVVWSIDGGEEVRTNMRWMGEYLFWADAIAEDGGMLTWSICAVDAAGLETCSAEDSLEVMGGTPPPPVDEGPGDADAGPVDPVEPDEDAGTIDDDVEAVEPDAPSDDDLGSGTDDAGSSEADTSGPADTGSVADTGSSTPTSTGSDGGCTTGSGGHGAPWFALLLLAALPLRRTRQSVF